MSDSFEGRARSDSSDVAFRKIFIGGLSYSTDEEKLRKYFKQFGSVQDAVVMKDPVSKRSRGFGFITFYDIASVDAALANEPHTIDGRKVEAKRAVPRSEMNKEVSHTLGAKSAIAGYSTPSRPVAASKLSSNSSSPGQTGESRAANEPKMTLDDLAYNKIFVGGLHYDTRDADFQSYFEQFGKVYSAEVMFNRETHKSRGFGFIVFESEESVDKVCDVKEHIIGGKVVEVKRAIPRSKMAILAAVPPSTPTRDAAGASTSGSPPNSNGSGGAVRSRRAMSAGNAQPVAASPMTLSGNSSTLTMSTQKPITSTPVSTRKALNPSSTGTPPIVPRTTSGPVASYATAVASGGSQITLSSASHDSIDRMESSHNRLGDSPPIQPTGVSLLHHSPPNLDVRNRAFSEPIYFLSEGSSALDGEILPSDLLAHASVGVIQPSSNNSSRSNSVIAPSTSANNLPWLSSPSTMPFESSDLPPFGLLLPPASQEGKSASIVGTINSESLFGGSPLNSQGIDAQRPPPNLFFPDAGSGPIIYSELDEYSPSLGDAHHRSGSNILGNRMRASSLNALGNVPVPDNWAALLQSHRVFQESFGIAMSPIAAQQRQQHQMFSFASEADGTWGFNDGNSSLFDAAPEGSSFGRAVGSQPSHGDSFSRVIGFTESTMTRPVLASNAFDPSAFRADGGFP